MASSQGWQSGVKRGILNLNVSNNYTGTTTLTAGELVVTNNNAIGTGNLIVNGGTLTSSPPAQLISRITSS